MTVKNISTRAKICGRSAKCTGGHSAVEQSSYISREKMYCEYDGQTYYPKYSEDLVHCEVLLPENAPEEYKDPYVLWNSVEPVEKAKDAQLARTFRIELPNEWSYDLADTINAVNAKIGMTDKFWEHRSFKEQGLDIIPQIHLGEKASAMERAGIRTIRGDINREIIAKNAVINAARAAYERAKEELAEVMAIPVTVAKAFKSEIIDVIRKIAERNNNRLTLPIMKGKFIGAVSDRASLQDKEKMEAYAQSKGWTTFDEMQADRKALQGKYEELQKSRGDMTARMDYLEKLLAFHEQYEPYQQVNAKSGTTNP